MASGQTRYYGANAMRARLHRELAEGLTAMGTPESDRNIANKISRGSFTAAFFIECLVAIGCQTVRLTED